MSTLTDHETAVKLVQTLRNKKGMSLLKIAILANLHYGTVYSYYKDNFSVHNRRMHVNHVRALAELM